MQKHEGGGGGEVVLKDIFFLHSSFQKEQAQMPKRGSPLRRSSLSSKRGRRRSSPRRSPRQRCSYRGVLETEYRGQTTKHDLQEGVPIQVMSALYVIRSETFVQKDDHECQRPVTVSELVFRSASGEGPGSIYGRIQDTTDYVSLGTFSVSENVMTPTWLPFVGGTPHEFDIILTTQNLKNLKTIVANNLAVLYTLPPYLIVQKLQAVLSLLT